MSNQELLAKEKFFEEQALLDLSDDERSFPDEESNVVSRALEDSRAMPPPTLQRSGSSFLGPTPKERQAEFEAYSAHHRAGVRRSAHTLTRSATEPETKLNKSTRIANADSTRTPGAKNDKIKRGSSLPNKNSINLTPFYKQLGTVPRELKNGKNVKLAENIKLEPEYKQLFKDKVFYFYPNDDISMVRRTRIHKLIQLGAAWVKTWRDDVTHIIVDDASYTYSQLLKHLNRAGLPVSVSTNTTNCSC